MFPLPTKERAELMYDDLLSERAQRLLIHAGDLEGALSVAERDRSPPIGQTPGPDRDRSRSIAIDRDRRQCTVCTGKIVAFPAGPVTTTLVVDGGVTLRIGDETVLACDRVARDTGAWGALHLAPVRASGCHRHGRALSRARP